MKKKESKIMDWRMQGLTLFLEKQKENVVVQKLQLRLKDPLII